MEKEIYTPAELLGLGNTEDELDYIAEEEANQMEGLGFIRILNRHGFRNRLRHAWSRAVHRSVTRSLKNAIAPKTVKALALHSKQFSTDTKRGIASGSVKSGDETFYIRREITGQTGIFEMFNDTIDKVAGITNISKAKLPELVNLLMDRMTIREGEGTDVKNAEYNPMTYGSTDPALLNGEISVVVGGKTVFTLPVNDFMKPKKNTMGPADGRDFDVPVFIPEQTNIQIRIEFAGTVDNTNQHFVEVAFHGASTKPVK